MFSLVRYVNVKLLWHYIASYNFRCPIDLVDLLKVQWRH